MLERIEATATWDDIVLPEEQLDLLHQIADHVANRGLVYETWGFGRHGRHRGGATVLFAGEPGTGKSLAAEVLATELRLDLYRIDLSAVVSKYIGETETNLRRLFDAAEDGGALLFFDEADALFGKRSEVKDSHDRYANLEVSFLLQLMEAYPGVAILAVCSTEELEPRLLRRFRFIEEFPLPGESDRRWIWERVFPPEAPLDEIDLERLVAIPATGGAIGDIALNAAFAAAHEHTAITMDLLLASARAELHRRELGGCDPGRNAGTDGGSE